MTHPLRKNSLRRVVPHLVTSFIAMTAVVLAGMAGVATAQKPPASAKVKHGEAVFKAQCIGCHSKEAGDTTPFGPPNLHGVVGRNPGITPAEATATIKQGKGIMPSFEGKLNGSDINDVVAYLKTL